MYVDIFGMFLQLGCIPEQMYVQFSVDYMECIYYDTGEWNIRSPEIGGLNWIYLILCDITEKLKYSIARTFTSKMIIFSPLLNNYISVSLSFLRESCIIHIFIYIFGTFFRLPEYGWCYVSCTRCHKILWLLLCRVSRIIEKFSEHSQLKFTFQVN